MKQLSISFILILFSFCVAANEQEIRNSLKNILPDGAQIESIKKTAIEGLYEVYYGDLEPIYVNKDGSFFIYGDIYKINTCLLYTSPSPRDGLLSRMPSSA